MAKTGKSIVTGDKELDAMFRQLPITLQKKHMRKATRAAAKKVNQEFKDNVPTETGALRDSAKVKAVKRKRNVTGHRVHIDREKLILERAARGGTIGFDKKRGEPFFYPAVIEFDPGGDKPLRSALYGNEDEIKREAIAGVKAMIREAEAKAATVR